MKIKSNCGIMLFYRIRYTIFGISATTNKAIKAFYGKNEIKINQYYLFLFLGDFNKPKIRD